MAGSLIDLFLFVVDTVHELGAVEEVEEVESSCGVTVRGQVEVDAREEQVRALLLQPMPCHLTQLRHYVVSWRYIVEGVDSLWRSEERWLLSEIAFLKALVLIVDGFALVVLISIHEHLCAQSFFRKIGAVKEITEVTKTHVSIQAIPVVFRLQVILEKIRVLEVFLALSTLVFVLRNASLLKYDDLFADGHELVLAEGALIAHADVVFAEDREDLLVDPVQNVRRMRQRTVVKRHML